MSPKTLLDSDILSRLMRAEPVVLGRAGHYVADHPRLTISLITRFEILRGLKARDALARVAAFNQFCAANEVIGLGENTIERASDIYADLRQRGQLIGDADILIAATALEHGMMLATHNISHFSRIAGLVIDDWAS